MSKTLALVMRVIVAASVLVMATAASKRVAAGMAKHMGVEAGTGGHSLRSGCESDSPPIRANARAASFIALRPDFSISN